MNGKKQAVATAGDLASLTRALADLTTGAETGLAMIDAVRTALPRLAVPVLRRSILSRLWGRLPGDTGINADEAVVALSRRLGNLIDHAEGRLAAIGWIGAQAVALSPAGPGDEAVRLQLLAATHSAARAEREAAAWGRHFLEITLPLWRSTQNAQRRHDILTQALKP